MVIGEVSSFARDYTSVLGQTLSGAAFFKNCSFIRRPGYAQAAARVGKPATDLSIPYLISQCLVASTLLV
jgi:hypothetical protein